VGKGFLIDTNAVIDFVAGRLPDGGNALMVQLLKSGQCISVITRIELLGFQDVPLTIREFADTAKVYPLDEEVESKTISLRKSCRLKLPDAIIAATAMTNGLKLLTRNTKDFDGIAGLDVVNPHVI
jgi:predicted nucleic acid-binding protein